jgi:hypothetical protein
MACKGGQPMGGQDTGEQPRGIAYERPQRNSSRPDKGVGHVLPTTQDVINYVDKGDFSVLACTWPWV